MSAPIFDDRRLTLGEGPLWHPLRKQYFWFDIMNRQLCSNVNGEALSWQFDEYVSAAGWVDETRLLIASQTQLFLFDVESGAQEHVVALEADDPVTRSNDGRADPWGGFWIGTMGINAEAQAGAIYRYYRGELRLLFPEITISNSICFAPDKSVAYYCDTKAGIIMRQALRAETGWPTGPAEEWLDLGADGLNPDGSVVDAAGNLWNAQWGAGRVACYSPQGTLLQTLDVPAKQATCPAFGGDDATDMLVTTANAGLDEAALAADPQAGSTFLFKGLAKGQRDHQVIL
ncbi:SMP-30/gluconolactonase/LRE family protein [Pseudoruegeria sp. SHC-113]|uniref:SMP-30/gluconolactonase/LRE family protein n=1 Tax=Pseudoruegeria sp. SHC-113 TaxID=2855439 RepID=UPI0021BAB2BE|nr:SMP-30/gluconolactonase/LRE family protein [Pseudoruegeria sp. SHC-113]MCT8158907.1 SMP-30/gluconolactonase/LRE family protein [Pseudoruegeria sp. SHC-113]